MNITPVEWLPTRRCLKTDLVESSSLKKKVILSAVSHGKVPKHIWDRAKSIRIRASAIMLA